MMRTVAISRSLPDRLKWALDAFLNRPVEAGSKIKVACIWTVKEKHEDLWVPVQRKKNTLTSYGLTQLAQSLFIAQPTLYMVLDQSFGTLQGALTAGQTSLVSNVRVDIAGDTQLVVSPQQGATNTEVVTFSAVTGTGPYTYTISALAHNHNIGDPVVRQVGVNDTIANSVLNEVQFDSINFPNARLGSGSGYSGGSGNWVQQFMYTGTQAIGWMMSVGLADSATVGAGNLFNHVILGYNHPLNTDIEVDANITITNAYSGASKD
jgi:hypothetical protein